MNIEDVIARSRESGGLSERKQFTVERSRAIQKLREFALADPSFYILEWIQAAVANGATYIDISLVNQAVRLSYVGGGFSRSELESLFDFLFASKDDLDVADVRQLALGVNALMGLKPYEIVMESGDGTLEGTTRIEIDTKADEVSVGTPAQALGGTFIVARWGPLPPERKEAQAIEDRCLTATIPIIVNDVPLFGYSTLRSPKLWGYPQTIEFDEGDLYGTLGTASTPITKNFKLLTFGTWISSTTHDFEGLRPMGGVIGFDRLRKTADHAKIVQDEVFAEMWARLLPYARQLNSGKSGDATFDVALLDGTTLTPRTFRELGISHGRLVVIDRSDVNRYNGHLPARFGVALDAPVVMAEDHEMAHVRALVGGQFVLHTPHLTKADLEFLEKPVADEPPRPWLTGTVDVPDMTIESLTHYFAPEDRAAQLATGAANAVSITVYTPSEAAPSGHTLVELRSRDRTIALEAVPSSFPGHHIVANLDGFPLSRLSDPTDRPIGPVVAQAVIACAADQLTEAADRVIKSGSRIGESSAARLIALGCIVRNAFLRIRRTESGVALRFARHSNAFMAGLLDEQIFQTFAGEAVSMADLGERLLDSGGLMYAAEAAGGWTVDPRRVVRANDAVKHLLRQAFGPLSFVDVDANDPSHLTPSSLTDQQVEELIHSLRSPALAPAAFRQLVARAVEGPPNATLDHTPLFRTAHGFSVTPAQIRERLSQGEVEMFDGWPHDFSFLAPDQTPDTAALAMESFTFHALSRLGPVVPVLDVDFSSSEAIANPLTSKRAFLEYSTIEEDGVSGILGFPMQRVEAPVLVWANRSTGATAALTETARHFGVVGRLTTGDVDEKEVRALVYRRTRSLLDRVVNLVGKVESDSEHRERALEILLDYCGPHVGLLRRPSGEIALSCDDPDAARILALPLVPTSQSLSVSIWRYLSDFAMYGDLTSGVSRIVRSHDAPRALERWLDCMLDVPPFVTEVPLPAGMGDVSQPHVWLSDMLAALRVDDQEPFSVVVQEQPPELSLVGDKVFVSVDGPLFQAFRTSTGPAFKEAASWLLLAIYAVINEHRLRVTNDHELQFQARILDWLDGTLPAPTPDIM